MNLIQKKIDFPARTSRFAICGGGGNSSLGDCGFDVGVRALDISREGQRLGLKIDRDDLRWCNAVLHKLLLNEFEHDALAASANTGQDFDDIGIHEGTDFLKIQGALDHGITIIFLVYRKSNGYIANSFDISKGMNGYLTG